MDTKSYKQFIMAKLLYRKEKLKIRTIQINLDLALKKGSLKMI
jgi:hypothetical protein